MAIRILTKNSIENTNIDGARANHFCAGMRSGIVRGALSEGLFYSGTSNTISLDPCELRISGHQVVIDSTQTFTLSNTPSSDTSYSLVAQIVVDSSGVPTFSLVIQTTSTDLVQNNLFSNINGSGTYQVEIGRFTLTTAGTVSNPTRTIDIITGGGAGNSASATQQATANTSYISNGYVDYTVVGDVVFVTISGEFANRSYSFSDVLATGLPSARDEYVYIGNILSNSTINNLGSLVLTTTESGFVSVNASGDLVVRAAFDSSPSATTTRRIWYGQFFYIKQ